MLDVINVYEERRNCSCLIEKTIRISGPKEGRHFRTYTAMPNLTLYVLTLPNIGGHNVPPLLGDRQYLPGEKAIGGISFLLFIFTYLIHSGQISWLYHSKFWIYDRFSKGVITKQCFHGQNTVKVTNT